MKIFGIPGWSGSGKTTVIRALIPVLVGRGLKDSIMKHAHHAYTLDGRTGDAEWEAAEQMILLPDIGPCGRTPEGSV